jgi:ABC-2 type transport system permease protein
VDTLGSFTREDVMVFLIVTFISDTVYMFLFSGNLFPLNRLVVQGDLDFVLLKPINSQFLVSFRYVKSYAIFSLIILLLMLLRQSHLHSAEIGIMNYLFFSMSFFCGLIIWYSLDFLIACLTFWFKNFTVGGWLSHEILKFSSRPDSIYTGFTRKLLFSLIPIALVSSVPTRMLLYGLNLKLLMYQIIISLGFVVLTFWVWKRGLLRYESASS